MRALAIVGAVALLVVGLAVLFGGVRVGPVLVIVGGRTLEDDVDEPAQPTVH